MLKTYSIHVFITYCDRLLKGGYLSIPQLNVNNNITEAGRGSYDDFLLGASEDEEEELEE